MTIERTYRLMAVVLSLPWAYHLKAGQGCNDECLAEAWSIVPAMQAMMEYKQQQEGYALAVCCQSC